MKWSKLFFFIVKLSVFAKSENAAAKIEIRKNERRSIFFIDLCELLFNDKVCLIPNVTVTYGNTCQIYWRIKPGSSPFSGFSANFTEKPVTCHNRKNLCRVYWTYWKYTFHVSQVSEAKFGTEELKRDHV